MDSAALQHQFGVRMKNCLDTQLVLEYMTGTMLTNLGTVLETSGVPPHPNKASVSRMLKLDERLWARRPLSHDLKTYAVADVVGLLKAGEKLKGSSLLGTTGGAVHDRSLVAATQIRCDRDPLRAGRRLAAFHPRSSRLMSGELYQALFQEDVVKPVKQQICDDIELLMKQIPRRFSENLYVHGSMELNREITSSLRDIILEVGARPYAYLTSGERLFLNDDAGVRVQDSDMRTQQDPAPGAAPLGGDHVAAGLLRDLTFGPDNRAGMDACLHRIAGIRSKTGRIYSLTCRVGRAIIGNTEFMTDLIKPYAKQLQSLVANAKTRNKEGAGVTPGGEESGHELVRAYNDPACAGAPTLFAANLSRFVHPSGGPSSDFPDLAPGSSVLLLGKPGSGKTTIIRDVARRLSVEGALNVLVVDTSNEICGGGIVPHPSVGMARRMMVPGLDQQGAILVEAVQNHTPDVIICDEIGRESEV